MEVRLAVFYRGTGHARGLDDQSTMVVFRFLRILGLFGAFQLFQFHLRLYIAKDDGGLLAANAFHPANSAQSLHAHRIAYPDGARRIVIRCLGMGSQFLTGSLLLRILLALPLHFAGFPLLHLPQFLGKVFFAH